MARTPGGSLHPSATETGRSLVVTSLMSRASAICARSIALKQPGSCNNPGGARLHPTCAPSPESTYSHPISVTTDSSVVIDTVDATSCSSTLYAPARMIHRLRCGHGGADHGGDRVERVEVRDARHSP